MTVNSIVKTLKEEGKSVLDKMGLITPEERTETYTLYLIRHGEASHNILEKKAVLEARKAAEAEGLDPYEVDHRVEEARKSVLDDPRLFDAALSDQGKAEAVKCHERLQELRAKYPPPSLVYVSPLQRALQTADRAFPDHTNIHVREQLRERQTGHACDDRTSSSALAQRKSYLRFSLSSLRADSVARQFQSLPPQTMPADDEDNDTDEDFELSTRSAPVFTQIEPKEMLRERTQQLFELLEETKDRSVAVVTHKGYLRELERGPFGIADSAEYENTEVRIYEVTIHKNALLEVKRLE